MYIVEYFNSRLLGQVCVEKMLKYAIGVLVNFVWTYKTKELH